MMLRWMVNQFYYKQSREQVIKGEYSLTKKLLDDAIKAGYGLLPHPWGIKLYLWRN